MATIPEISEIVIKERDFIELPRINSIEVKCIDIPVILPYINDIVISWESKYYKNGDVFFFAQL